MRHKMVQIDYEKLNALYETLVPYQEPSAKQTYFSIPSTSDDGSTSKDVPSESPAKLSTLHDVNMLRKHQVESTVKERENSKHEFQKLFNSIKATQAQHQKEINEMFEDVTQKTYAYADVRAQNQDLLMTISKLKSKLKTINKGKHVNTKFDKSETLGQLLYVTPFNKNIAINAKNMSNTKVTSDSLDVFLHSHEKFVARNALIRKSSIKRGLFTSPVLAKSKSLGATSVVPKSRFSVAKTLTATNTVSSVLPLSQKSSQSRILSSYMNNKIATSRKWKKWFEYQRGLGHNLFSVRQFCDEDLEVAFRSNTCYVWSLEGDDLLMGSRDSNLYTISISEMAASSPMCLMSIATSIKSWLWHSRLSHLNFGTINQLTLHDLVDGLPKFKYHKNHLCSACEQGKSKKASLRPKLVPSTESKLELLHGFLWANDEAPDMIIDFVNQVQRNLKALILTIRTDNGTEFKNEKLRAFYAKLGIAARTMLMFSKAPEFLWAEAIATACFTQNRSIVHTWQNKTPYELIHGRKPNVQYFHVFGSLCYPTNDCDDLGKMKPKADIGIFVGYSESSSGFRIYNRRTKKIMETIHVKFDELTAMASECNNLEPGMNYANFNDSSEASQSVPSTSYLDNLFGPMYEEYYVSSSQEVTDNSTANTLDNDHTSSSSSIVVEQDGAPQIVSFSEDHVVTEPNSPVLNEVADEFVQEDVTDFDGNTFHNAPQTPEFGYPDFPNHIYHLKKALYGLKQAPRAWYDKLSSFLIEHLFTKGIVDPTLFTRRHRDDILIVQIYVDDIIFGSTKLVFSNRFKKLMKDNFEMSMIGEMKFFLRLQVHQSPRGIFISQSHHTMDILKKHMMEKCDTVSTPIATTKLDADLQGTLVDQTKYRSTIGGLMYLTVSRPYIAFATFLCARYQTRPTEKYLKEVKRIFYYLRQSINMGLWYTKDSRFERITYADADHAGCNDDCKSTSGGVQFLGDNLVSWSSKKQDCTDMSFAEAEYVSLSACCAQVIRMRTQLLDYGFHYHKILIYYDSKSAMSYLTIPYNIQEQNTLTSAIISSKSMLKKRIVANRLMKFPNISKRIDEDYHSIKDDIPLTNNFKEYETVFMKVDVPMNQPKPVVSTQGTHKITPSAHRSPIVSAIKKDDDDSEERIEPRSHKDNPKVVDADDDDKEIETKDDEMGSLEIRNEETRTTISTPLSFPRKILSSDKKTSQELTDIVSYPTTTTSKHSQVKKRISSKDSHILGALRRMCMRQGYMIQDMERKCVTTAKFLETHNKIDDILHEEFKAHTPAIITELFKNHIQSNVIHVHPTTTTSTETESSADL
ncbi:retrovirus-related pol polyprotein from transposon TNT 1-94 [Tanacetum coccineum]